MTAVPILLHVCLYELPLQSELFGLLWQRRRVERRRAHPAVILRQLQLILKLTGTAHQYAVCWQTKLRCVMHEKRQDLQRKAISSVLENDS